MKPSPIALSPADRQTLITSAPTEPGDHVVSIQRGAQHVYSVVRVDSCGPRIVSIAATACDALAKSRPTAAIGSVMMHRDGAAAAARSARGGQRRKHTQAQRRAAETSMRSEVADYRRAVAGVTGEAAKLV
jgi:hypothetical protein